MSTSEVFSAPPSISSACPVIVPANLLALRPAKIRDHHLLRKAVVYIRQSSPQQEASIRCQFIIPKGNPVSVHHSCPKR